MMRSCVPAFLLLALVACSTLSALDIQPGNEYNLLLDDGEVINKVKVTAANEVAVVVEVAGLAKELRIPRKIIRSAVLLVKVRFFSGWEIGVFGDFNLALGDLTLLANYFPQGALTFTGKLTNPMRYVGFNALSAEISYMYISDGERQIQGAGFAISPRWYFNVLKVNWVAGLGGGLTGLYLKSYNFTRLSYAPSLFFETGVIEGFGSHVHLYGLIRVNYWADSQALLNSVGARLGVGYSW